MKRLFGFIVSKPGRRIGVPLLAAALIAVFAAPGALAVHDIGVFQLDGDASTASNPGPVALEDWDLICKANPTTCPVNPDYPTVSGSTVSKPNSFLVDPSQSSTDDILKGGTKDDNDIGTWNWTSAKPSPPKNDITDGYAAEYTCNDSAIPPASNNVASCTGGAGHKLLYFGADRLSNNGSANIAFWFFQSKVTQTPHPAGGTTCDLSSGCAFSGSHTVGNVSLGCSNGDGTGTCTPGDILIISAFGPKAQIFVYEWVGTGNATKNYLGSNSCFTAACSLQPLFLSGTNSDCPEATGDNACAVANSASSQSPWLLPQSGAPNNYFAPTDFFEGGIDLTQLGLGSSCFPSFLINTRASAAGDAELHDKIIGQLERCAPNLTTQASTNGEVAPGTAVTDRATVLVTGATNPNDPLGSVQFYLCGPIATGGCTSTSNAIGSAVTLTNAACSPASTSETDGKRCAVSVSVNDSGQTGNRGSLSPGRYCFRAKATLTNYNSPDEFTNDTTECFTVTKSPSSLDTAPWIYPNDKATVSTAFATNISGNVTFRLFGATTGVTPHDAAYNCQNDDGTTSALGLLYRETVALPTTTATSKTVNTSNPGTTGTPTSVKVESTAIVYWRVSYGGDSLHFGRLSTCVENINVTLTPDTGGTAP